MGEAESSQKKRASGRAGRKAEAADLRELAEALASAQALAAEWAALHQRLHDVLSACGPFCARLALPQGEALDEAGRQALLHDWLPCQEQVDRLADFAEQVTHIGTPFCREGRALRGARWAVEIVALQLLLEDALKEPRLEPGLLLEPAEAFRAACHRHLALANRALRAAMERCQYLSTSLLGGSE